MAKANNMRILQLVVAICVALASAPGYSQQQTSDSELIDMRMQFGSVLFVGGGVGVYSGTQTIKSGGRLVGVGGLFVTVFSGLAVGVGGLIYSDGEMERDTEEMSILSQKERDSLNLVLDTMNKWIDGAINEARSLVYDDYSPEQFVLPSADNATLELSKKISCTSLCTASDQQQLIFDYVEKVDTEIALKHFIIPYDSNGQLDQVSLERIQTVSLEIYNTLLSEGELNDYRLPSGPEDLDPSKIETMETLLVVTAARLLNPEIAGLE